MLRNDRHSGKLRAGGDGVAHRDRREGAKLLNEANASGLRVIGENRKDGHVTQGIKMCFVQHAGRAVTADVFQHIMLFILGEILSGWGRYTVKDCHKIVDRGRRYYAAGLVRDIRLQEVEA